jgi:hypothetical protein
MSRPLRIRVPGPLEAALLEAGLAQPIPSAARSGPLELVLDASIVVRDVASVVLAVAAGVGGVRAILERLRREDPGTDVVVTIHSARADHAWTLEPGRIDDATIEDIARALDAAIDEPR